MSRDQRIGNQSVQAARRCGLARFKSAENKFPSGASAGSTLGREVRYLMAQRRDTFAQWRFLLTKAVNGSSAMAPPKSLTVTVPDQVPAS